MRRRSLLWLLAIAAFVLVPAVGPAVPAVAGKAMMADCDHPPPPPPCPDSGSAKHAAEQCCPSMSAAVAVLPPAGLAGAPEAPPSFVPAGTLPLIGLSPHEDPPPPRV